MRRTLVAGHVCLDLVPEVGAALDVRPGRLVEVGPMAVCPGGCVSNTGGDLAALGAPVRLVGEIGDDELGAILRRLLDVRPRVTASWSVRPATSTSYSIVLQPPGQDRAFWHHVGANAFFDGSGLAFSDEALLHVGYPTILPALLVDTAAPLRDLLGRARRSGLTTSVDLSVVDAASPVGRLDWQRLLAAVLPLVDVLSPSVDDIASVGVPVADVTADGLSAAAARLVAAGVAVVMLTAGQEGLLLRTAGASRLADGGAVLAGLSPEWADREVWVPAAPAGVAGTTGTGDAATAGLLYGLLSGAAPERTAVLAAAVAAARLTGRDELPPYGDPVYDVTVPAPTPAPSGWRRGARGEHLGPSDRVHPRG